MSDSENKEKMKILGKLLKELGLTPLTGYGETFLHFNNNNLTKAQVRIDYKVDDNVLIINENKF